MTNYYHIFLYSFVNYLYCFIFYAPRDCHRGISLCRQHNDNKVLELESLPKSIHARTSTSAKQDLNFRLSKVFFFFVLVILKHRNLDIGVCSLYDNDIN